VSRIRLQLDEDCQSWSLASALRQHGIDTQTSNDSALSGVDDSAQLIAARKSSRVFVTNNIRDFVPLHKTWRENQQNHSGIIVFHQQEFSTGEIVRRIIRLSRTLSAEEKRDRLEWLSSWGAG
jgi:hypothetical protein